MKIEFSGQESFCERQLVKRVTKLCLAHLGQPKNVELSFSFADEESMKDLNNRSRGKNSVTDVLSFPAHSIMAGQVLGAEHVFPNGKIFIGDIVVCKEQIVRQAKEYQNTYKQELQRMVLHSVLHLLGYDHIDPQDEKQMKAVEVVLLQKILGAKYQQEF